MNCSSFILSLGCQKDIMGKVVNFPQTLEKHLLKLRTNGGIYEFDKGKFAIKHKEVERLANEYGIETDIKLEYCDLTKGTAVVKAVAKYQGNKFTSLGEVSPLNNEFPYPIRIFRFVFVVSHIIFFLHYLIAAFYSQKLSLFL